MSENLIFRFSSRKLSFFFVTRPTKFSFRKNEMIENTCFMYLYKKIIKHFADKSFSVFNGPPPNAIKHTNFFWFIVLLLYYEAT